MTNTSADGRNLAGEKPAALHTDYTVIDDTPGGRASLAVGLGVITALPRWVPDGKKRAVWTAATAAATVGAVAYFNNHDDDPNNDLTLAELSARARGESAEGKDIEVGVGGTWATVAGAGALIGLLGWVNDLGNRLLINFLDRMHVPAPGTTLGVLTAVAGWCVLSENQKKEVEARVAAAGAR